MSAPFKRDEAFIQRTLELALRGRGSVSPNPMVGALVVKDGVVVGQGFHRRAGQEHAEVMALKEAGPRARGAALYVNLEPCCHHGQTPPCVEQIIKAKIKRVAAAMVDPNPLVKGKGLAALKRAGVQTRAGILEDQARRLNEVFIKYITTGLPFVILKAGLTLDGKIADAFGRSRWITGAASRQRVHAVRGWVDAILVGVGTVKQDNPALTARGASGKTRGRQPLSVIIDYKGEIPLHSKVVEEKAAKTLVVLSSEASPKKIKSLTRKGIEILVMDGGQGRFRLKEILKKLGERKITSVMIEGGAEINASALEEKIVDKILFFYAPKILGAPALSVAGGKGWRLLPDAYKITDLTLERLGEDFLLEGYLETSPCSPASYQPKAR